MQCAQLFISISSTIIEEDCRVFREQSFEQQKQFGAASSEVLMTLGASSGIISVLRTCKLSFICESVGL